MEPLKICVCIKQVPNTDKAKFNWETGTLERSKEEDENCINPDDLHAIEAALILKEKYNATISVITLGPPQAKWVLYEAMAYGIDKAYLISDPVFAGADTLITARTLARAIRYIGNFDIVITGFETIDGNTGHVSYQLAEYLDIPHITQIKKIELFLDTQTAEIERIYGHEYQKIRTTLPILLAFKRDDNQVRYPHLRFIAESFSRKIEVIGFKDLGGKKEEYGKEASPTVTLSGDVIEHKRKRIEFKGDLEEKITQLIHKLKKYNILQNI